MAYKKARNANLVGVEKQEILTRKKSRLSTPVFSNWSAFDSESVKKKNNVIFLFD
jgi:hypothetical protein